jgi:hypothetical protein
MADSQEALWSEGTNQKTMNLTSGMGDFGNRGNTFYLSISFFSLSNYGLDKV